MMIDNKYKNFYFAYGSNMNLDLMKKRLPEAQFVSKGILKDYEFCFPKIAMSRSFMGVLDIKESKDKYILGSVYMLSDEDLERLDKIEGVSSGQYSRKMLEVNVFDKMRSCNVYLSNIDKSKNYTPSKNYLLTTVIGLVGNECNIDYLQNLISIYKESISPTFNEKFKLFIKKFPKSIKYLFK